MEGSFWAAFDCTTFYDRTFSFLLSDKNYLVFITGSLLVFFSLLWSILFDFLFSSSFNGTLSSLWTLLSSFSSWPKFSFLPFSLFDIPFSEKPWNRTTKQYRTVWCQNRPFWWEIKTQKVKLEKWKPPWLWGHLRSRPEILQRS